MASKIIYPYGTNGQLPSSIGLVNDLKTGGVNQALTAEMGKELGEDVADLKDATAKAAVIEDVDKFSIDGIFMRRLLQPDEFTRTDGAYIRRTDGVIVDPTTQQNPTTTHAYIRIDAENFRGSSLFVAGVTNNIGYALGYAFYNANDEFISGNYIWQQAQPSTATITMSTSAAYVLISMGSKPDEFRAAWDTDYIPVSPPRTYDVVSFNGGVGITAERISWLSNADEAKMKSGLFERLNKLDLRNVVSGYRLSVTNTSATIKQQDGYSALFQEVPAGVSSVSIHGMKGTNAYFGWAFMDENSNVVSFAWTYNKQDIWLTKTVPQSDGKLYIVCSASSSEYSVEDLVILYDNPDAEIDSAWITAHANDVVAKHNVELETLPSNLISDPNTVVTRSADVFTFTFPVNGEKYLFWYWPSGKYVNTADTFIQYDENDNVLLSENVYAVSNVTNFGRYGIHKQLCGIVRLQSGCAKILIKAKFSDSGTASWAIRRIIANGNKMYLTNDRQVYWRAARTTSIDGIALPVSKNPLEGLTICCLGDSITDFGNESINFGYPKYIQSNFDCACINYGRGNARFIDASNTDPTKDTDPGTPSSGTAGNENNKVSVQVRWMLRELQEDGVTPDVVILSGGTNDCFSEVNYGTLADAMANYGNTTDAVKTTFYDAAVYMVSKIRAAFPSVKIFFGTPIDSQSDTQSPRLPAWREAMMKAADAMGCGIIDWYARSGVVSKPTSNNPCMADGLHPSKLGVDMMAKLAVSEIAKAFPR